MKKKLRIAIVISHPIQHFCPQYVSFSKNKSIEFKVFFGSALGYQSYIDQNFKKEISWANLNLEKFDHFFLNGDKVIPPDRNLDAPSLEKELSEYNPDVLFTYGYFQKLQRRASRWAKKNKVAIAYISDSELRHRENKSKEFLKSIFLKRYFSGMDYFLSVGNANEAYYAKYNVKKSKIIRMHYPIDFEKYEISYRHKETLRNNIRSSYKIGEDEIVLSVVGKLVPWKNQDHLIDALQLLEKQKVHAQLFIIGSGEMEERWQQKASVLKHSGIHFTGFVDIDELPSYYAATDIYVHPASLEPHSVAISEAIQMGCPVILSDRCGSYGETDDVQVGKNGYIFEFGNVPELAEKIKQLAADKELRSQFGKYSHEIAVRYQNTSHYGMIQVLADRFKASSEN